MEKNIENCIEWLVDQDTVTVSFSDTNFINDLKKAVKKFPDKCDIEINPDKSAYGHIPLSWITINIPKKTTSKKTTTKKTTTKKQ